MPTPSAARNSALSAAASCAISASIWAQTTTTGASRRAASSCTEASSGLSSKPPSPTLATNIMGLAVMSRSSRAHSSAFSSNAAARAGVPAPRASRNASRLAMGVCAPLGFALVSRRQRVRARSTVSKSAKASSVSTTSTSSRGEAAPATWATSVSSKQRTTWATACVSRMWARNRLPSPSPLEAPATKPAMSTNSVAAGTMRADFASAPMRRSRSSHSGVAPTFLSMVQNGKLAAFAPALVRALKSVDLPTLGKPTMPQRKPIRGRSRCANVAASWPSANRR